MIVTFPLKFLCSGMLKPPLLPGYMLCAARTHKKYNRQRPIHEKLVFVFKISLLLYGQCVSNASACVNPRTPFTCQNAVQTACAIASTANGCMYGGECIDARPSDAVG